MLFDKTNEASQDEERLLCEVATEHDQTKAIQLANTSGWQTLMAILESYGERTLKRPWPMDGANDEASSDAGTPSEQLAKRFKQASIQY